MDGPERGIGSGGKCCGLFCFVFTFTFIFALTFSFEGSQGDWGQRVCLYLYVCLCLCLCPFLCPCLCPLEGLQLGGGSRLHSQRARGQRGLGSCGYVILPGGGVAHLKRERVVHAMSQLFDLFHPRGTAPSPALHHLGWPWLGAPLLRCLKVQLSTPPLRLPWFGIFLLFFSSFFSSFLLPACPARWNPKWFRSKVIICLLLLRRLLPWNGPKWPALSKFVEES